MHELTSVDYVILTASAGGAVFGLFIGFSGALAFLSGAAGAAATGVLGWGLICDHVATPWLRVLATVVACIVAFGLARMIVRRFVRVLIAQPADALFGALAAGLATAACALGAVWLGRWTAILPYPSALLDEVLAYVA